MQAMLSSAVKRVKGKLCLTRQAQSCLKGKSTVAEDLLKSRSSLQKVSGSAADDLGAEC